MDKETTEVKVDNVKDNKVSELLTHTVDSQETKILAQSEQPKTEKPTKHKTTQAGQ